MSKVKVLGAFYEQTGLVSEIPEFEMTINKKHKNRFDIRHVHTVKSEFLFSFKTRKELMFVMSILYLK